MSEVSNYLLNADIAFSNKKHKEALIWYQKVLGITPDDMYALSRAGAICVSLGKFDEALMYFEKAKCLDSANGDNAYNYGNACFFNNDNTKAFEAYVEAEKLGCSDDVMPRLYYQLALLCSMRQDIKSALVYFRKCENADKSGMIALNPDLISEKMKLFMLMEDYVGAEQCASQLVAIQPTQFRYYMVYFSILMAKKDYINAEKVLNDAQIYSDMNTDDKVTILLQLAALYVAKAENASVGSESYFNQAITLLKGQIKASNISPAQMVNVLQTLSEVYLKAGHYKKSIICSQYILKGTPIQYNSYSTDSDMNVHELTSEEIEAMMQADMELIQKKIDTGELSADLGLYAEMEYNDEGNLVPKYDETIFAMLDDSKPQYHDKKDQGNGKARSFDISMDIREKVYFTLLSCYLAMDDFESAEKYAVILKHSSNKYYNYYGVYTYAFITKKLNRNHALADKEYAEAIAFFRNKAFADHNDTLSVIFRARLYAEQGKYDKARELAVLLAESDQTTLLDYIKECQG